ncbi:SoxR reducing system RseC family protein [Marinicella sp. W31]|uniref:SoxR reducing system RseC family protein n=1 Tax=Marinicella sp. W31 TaxID=3023713 RepID=UPI0037579F4E
MIRQARIVEIDDHTVLLELMENLRCADCTALCSKRLFSLFGQQNNTIAVTRGVHHNTSMHIGDNGFFTEQHQMGQVIVIRIHENHILYSSIRLYLLPIILLLVLLAAGYGLFKIAGWPADLGGLLGFICGLVWLAYGHKKITRPEVTFLNQ